MGGWGYQLKSLRPLAQLELDLGDSLLGVDGHVSALGELLAQEPVGRSNVCQAALAASWGRTAASIRR